MRRVLVPTAYAALGALALGLIVLNVLAWTGHFKDDSQPLPASAPRERPTPSPNPSAQPDAISRPRPERQEPSAGTTLSIRAARGDCWVEVRADSASGEILYAGTLATGRSLRFHRDKLWLRLGAASNVDVLVNGRQSTVPPGTVELQVPT